MGEQSNIPAGSVWAETAPATHDIIKFEAGVPVRLRLTGPAIKFKKPDGKYRFASMAYVYSGSEPNGLRLFFFGWQTQAAIRGLYELSGDPTGYDLAIVARGEGLKRSYTVSALAPSDAPPELFAGTVEDLQQLVAAIVKPVAKSEQQKEKQEIPEDYDPFED